MPFSNACAREVRTPIIVPSPMSTVSCSIASGSSRASSWSWTDISANRWPSALLIVSPGLRPPSSQSEPDSMATTSKTTRSSSLSFDGIIRCFTDSPLSSCMTDEFGEATGRPDSAPLVSAGSTTMWSGSCSFASSCDGTEDGQDALGGDALDVSRSGRSSLVLETVQAPNITVSNTANARNPANLRRRLRTIDISQTAGTT